MRTTLDIDDAVLRAARSLAEQRTISLGAAVSHLALRGLIGTSNAAQSGFPLLPRFRDHVVTEELVAEHRDG